jgi:hypothetical protein
MADLSLRRQCPLYKKYAIAVLPGVGLLNYRLTWRATLQGEILTILLTHYFFLPLYISIETARCLIAKPAIPVVVSKDSRVQLVAGRSLEIYGAKGESDKHHSAHHFFRALTFPADYEGWAFLFCLPEVYGSVSWVWRSSIAGLSIIEDRFQHKFSFLLLRVLIFLAYNHPNLQHHQPCHFCNSRDLVVSRCSESLGIFRLIIEVLVLSRQSRGLHFVNLDV